VTFPIGIIKIPTLALVECRFEDETIWLNQGLMAELYQKYIRMINKHLKNIYAEGELFPAATIRKRQIVRSERTRSFHEVDHYCLDAILAVAYRFVHCVVHNSVAGQRIGSRNICSKAFLWTMSTLKIRRCQKQVRRIILTKCWSVSAILQMIKWKNGAFGRYTQYPACRATYNDKDGSPCIPKLQ
jgi:hypothetical protein